MRKLTTIALTAAACAALLAAQEATKAESKKGTAPAKSGILQPQMKVGPDGGSYDKPAGTMGTKTGVVWTETTIASGVDKKPLAGKTVTVTGEIIDLSCYLQLGKHGEAHKSCGTKCLESGQPIGLLAKDGTVYMLMAEEHDPRRDGQTQGFRRAAIDNFAKILEVTGTETTVRGYRAIFVQGYVNK